MKYFLYVIQFLVAAIMINAAWFKLSSHPESVELFTKLSMEPTGRVVIGLIEMGAGFLLLIPNTAALGALMAFSVMCGAFIAHVSVLGFGEVILSTMFVTSIIGSAIVLFFKRKTLPIIGRTL